MPCRFLFLLDFGEWHRDRNRLFFFSDEQKKNSLSPQKMEHEWDRHVVVAFVPAHTRWGIAVSDAKTGKLLCACQGVDDSDYEFLSARDYKPLKFARDVEELIDEQMEEYAVCGGGYRVTPVRAVVEHQGLWADKGMVQNRENYTLAKLFEAVCSTKFHCYIQVVRRPEWTKLLPGDTTTAPGDKIQIMEKIARGMSIAELERIGFPHWKVGDKMNIAEANIMIAAFLSKHPAPPKRGLFAYP